MRRDLFVILGWTRSEPPLRCPGCSRWNDGWKRSWGGWTCRLCGYFQSDA